MKATRIWANFGVKDLDRTTEFYTQLGFKPNGASDQLTSFLFGDDDFVIHFFLKEILETNVKVILTDPETANEIVFTLSADSQEDVHTWAEEVTRAGGLVVSQPEAFGPGYYGCVFADPDGHKFNVFHM
ncbi:MAG TPA: VOC family protein [Dyadobacter sp.]|jgi:hypothetical protein|nr:VOC family protein [Dyadobacter sp.]